MDVNWPEDQDFKPTLDTWVISDTHFYHKNIEKFTKRPDGWLTTILNYWEDLIAPHSEVLHLGDIFMGLGSKEKASSLLPALKGNKYMLRGNHDHESDSWYSAAGFNVVGKESRLYLYWENKKVCISHYPECRDLNWDINIHGHIHDGGYAPGTPYKDYRNVCVEVMGFRPVKLRQILEGDLFESRDDAPEWSLEKFMILKYQNKLTENFCEREFLT